MRPELTIDAARCVHRLAAVARCSACVQACPRSAWSIDADGLGFDEVRCDGCGLCVPACPTGALAVPLPWPAPRLEGDGVRTVSLRCERAGGAAPEGTTLPCIHAVDEALLMRWHSQGVGRVDVVTGACDSCARRPSAGLPQRLQRLNEALRIRGQRMLRMVHGGDRADAAAAGAGAGPRLASVDSAGVGPGVPSSRALPAPDRGRRGLLGLRRGPQPMPLPSGVSSAAGAALAPRREAVQQLARLGPGPALWAVALDASRCDACGACARLCPTQAIAVAPTEANTRDGSMTFEMARCVGCDVCVDACDARALAPAGPLQVTGARRAWALTPVNCRACGKGYRALLGTAAFTAGRCPSCRSVGARRSDRIVQVSPTPPGGADVNAC